MEKPVFIIAEIGINANGDIELAKKLIKGAKTAGASAVKFQKRSINKVYSQTELDKYRESPWGTTNRAQKEGLEFGYDEYVVIDAYCKLIGINWFASPWDMGSVDFLKQFNLKYNKVPSALLNHRELLNAIASQKKYTFISTGMFPLNDIQEAVYIFRKHECPCELMHCNSQYPMEDKDANLNCIPMLKKVFNCDVGFSDHAVGVITSAAAVAIGATSIEKHITINRSMYGSDQAASVEVTGFERLVKYVRAVESAMGDGVKRISLAEEQIKLKLARTSDYGS